MADPRQLHSASEFVPGLQQPYGHFPFHQNGGPPPRQPYLLGPPYGAHYGPPYRARQPRGRPAARRGRGRLAPNSAPPPAAMTMGGDAHGGQFGGQPPARLAAPRGHRGMARGRGSRRPHRGRGHAPQRGPAHHEGAPGFHPVDLPGAPHSSSALEPGNQCSDRNQMAGKASAKHETTKPKNRVGGASRASPGARPQYRGSTETQTGSMIQQLTEGSYECTVCCETVRTEAAIWSCPECYTVFHLRCIKKWARSAAAAAEDSDGWQCPMCRNVTLPVPNAYNCFCGKRREPASRPGELPHGCGEVCRRRRPAKADCPHACSILCHPGPCPPCPASVRRPCLCGRTEETIRCGTGRVVRCQQACGRVLGCGRHACRAVCHDGECQPCQVELKQGCYCGKDTRVILCSRDQDGNPLTEGDGQYACEDACDRMLTCGNHRCQRPCHPEPCDPCPLTPSEVTRCPCGHTRLSELEDGPARTSCLDPVPTCQNPCGKPLKCGGEDIHTCSATCHEGDCPDCPLISTVRCRCGHRLIDVPCREFLQSVDRRTGQASLACDRRCPKKKSCGKHKCNARCCLDKEHQCALVCGRLLNCGLHRCEEMCHPGNCVRCLNASFDELSCHCGAAVLMPPIHCGTRPPDCSNPCARRHPCEHPVRHNCHSEEACPPCVELTSKMCHGNHETRYNIPCHIKDISCGRPCERELPCGMHTCTMICHKGACDACKQPCLKARPDCAHPCSAPCHRGTPCPPVQCRAKFVLHCPCGNRSESIQCLQGGDDTRLTEAFQRLATSTLAGHSGEDVDISQLMALRNSKKQRVLECDQKCAVLSRNKRLASALQIKDPEVSKFPTTYNPFLKEQARKNISFVAGIIKELSTLVTAAQNSKQASRSHAFPSMNRDQRRVVHELSEMYGCESQSYDQEPKRNVVTSARKGTCFLPSVPLTSVVDREGPPKAPPPIVHTKHEAPRRLTSLSKMNQGDVPSSPPAWQKTPDADPSDVPDSWEVR